MPQPGPQTEAYHSKADIIGYGGAAGGGKTDLILGLALTRHTKSVIFRRQATELRDIIDRSRQLIRPPARLNENYGIWRGLPDGRTLEFGGVKDEHDVEKWRGRPPDLKAFDEATEFTEAQVRMLIAWNRTTIPGQHCSSVLCFNPPATAEGRWVIPFFGPWIDATHPRPALPGELRWFATVPGGKEIECQDGTPFKHGAETIQPLSRTFFPANLNDNPFLRDTGYRSRLQALPEPLRSQLLLGDFLAGIEDDPWQVIPTAWVRAAQARWKPDGRNDVALSAIGVDVARGGSAQTVLARRYGRWFGPLEKHAGKDTPDGPSVQKLIQRALLEHPQAMVLLDVIGVGSSVYDFCRRVEGMRVYPIHFGQRTDARDKSGELGFVNMRAFAWWTLRELLDPANGHDLALPPDPELLADLTAPRWEPRGGNVLIEEKEKIAERIGRSTDCGDAVCYAILHPRVPRIGTKKVVI